MRKLFENFEGIINNKIELINENGDLEKFEFEFLRKDSNGNCFFVVKNQQVKEMQDFGFYDFALFDHADSSKKIVHIAEMHLGKDWKRVTMK